MTLRFGWLEVHAVDHCNNNCRWCNNSSPFFPEVNHEPEEFFPWLDILQENRIHYDYLSIMGGEPFLHPGLLRFMYKLKERYNKPFMLTTNAFWLCKEALEAYHPIWMLTNLLFVSYYPNLLKNIGGEKQADTLLNGLRKKYPHMKIDIRKQYAFTELDHAKAPHTVQFFCHMSECTVLRADGVMARCGFGGFAHQSPHAVSEVTESEHMFYDLKNPFKPGRFWHWRKRWPLDACAHCTGALHKRTNWKIERGTKRNKDIELRQHLATAITLYNSDRQDAAFSCLRRLQEHYPDAKEIFNTLGVLSYNSQKLEESKSYLEKALEIDPAYQEAKNNYLTLIKNEALATHPDT